jgi:hypothetical protein
MTKSKEKKKAGLRIGGAMFHVESEIKRGHDEFIKQYKGKFFGDLEGAWKEIEAYSKKK